ncbi:hypothetical protein FXO37_10396 [Capsicum annuum]|nr:hypothetical protein FXO37_10396 [Capsicum annuum]
MSRVPYSSEVGSLMYAMMCTHPDICHAVGLVSRYQSNPGRIFRYLKGTADYSLCYSGSNLFIRGYTDSWAGDRYDRKSTFGYAFLLNGGAISWKSDREGGAKMTGSMQLIREFYDLSTAASHMRSVNKDADTTEVLGTNQLASLPVDVPVIVAPQDSAQPVNVAPLDSLTSVTVTPLDSSMPMNVAPLDSSVPVKVESSIQ